MDNSVPRSYYRNTMTYESEVRDAVDATTCSLSTLAREAGVSPRLLRMICAGDRRLTRETRDVLLRAIRAREARSRRATEALAEVDPEPRS